MRRDVGAGGTAAAHEFELDGAARQPPHCDLAQRRGKVADLRQGQLAGAGAGDADSCRIAPDTHPRGGGVGAVDPRLQLKDDRTALTEDALKNSFLDNLFYVQGKFPALATKHDYYLALAYAVRDRMLQRWISTAAIYTKQASRTVAYLSAEFLMGPHLGNNLINLGMFERAKHCMTEMGLN